MSNSEEFLNMEEVAPAQKLRDGLYEFNAGLGLAHVTLRWPIVTKDSTATRALFTLHMRGLEAFGYGGFPDETPCERFVFDIRSHIPEHQKCGMFGRDGERMQPAHYAVFVVMDMRSQIIFCPDFCDLAEFLRLYQQELLRPVLAQGRQLVPIG